MISSLLIQLLLVWRPCLSFSAFVVNRPIPPLKRTTMLAGQDSLRSTVALQAGGFQWDDPMESFDQGVENPFKNPGLMNSEEGLKIDPARLLSPRLNGSNLYLIGMMGTGKSSVGNIVARRVSWLVKEGSTLIH
jgi:hypothetical protein